MGGGVRAVGEIELRIGFEATTGLLCGVAEIIARENGSRFTEPAGAGGLNCFVRAGDGASSEGLSGLG